MPYEIVNIVRKLSHVDERTFVTWVWAYSAVRVSDWYADGFKVGLSLFHVDILTKNKSFELAEGRHRVKRDVRDCLRLLEIDSLFKPRRAGRESARQGKRTAADVGVSDKIRSGADTELGSHLNLVGLPCAISRKQSETSNPRRSNEEIALASNHREVRN
jgi:hypothetical protein